MKIVVIGYSKMFASIIDAVLASNHELVGVLRHDKIKFSPLKLWFKDLLNPSNDYSFIKSKKIYEIKAHSANSDEFKKRILKLNPDIIFVCSWSEKIKKEIYELPKLGTINVHPSLLPKYRGPNPYAQVLFNNEKFTGVTFHFLSEKIDTGPILFQQEFKILDSDDGESIRNKASELAYIMCKKFLELNEIGFITPEPQDENESTYQPAITLKDCILDFSLPSNIIAKRIKGLYPWARAYIDCGNRFLEVKDFEISKLTFDYEPGLIVKKTGRDIAIATVDKKIITFKNTKLVKTLFYPSTRLFIKFGLGDKIKL